MSISCKFHLTRSSSIYYTGERIEGSVIIRPLKSRQVEAIYLQFCGQTQVAWWDVDKTENDNNNFAHNDFSTQEVRQKVMFSNQQKHVCDQLQLANTQWLQPHCDYNYQFSFLIPQHVPATSRCPLGECEYKLHLQLQHTKKVNKEFHQNIIVKRKLDLSQILGNNNKEPFSVTKHNTYGNLTLTIPCMGFTPGQKIPYLLDFKALQLTYKVLVQLNCFIRCRSTTPRDKEKVIKQIINFQKHSGFGKIMSHLIMPLDCHISRPIDEEETKENELILNYRYMLEALVIDGNRKILLSVAIPLTIGTTPCFISPHEEEEYEDEKHSMCFDNYGSPHGSLGTNSMDSVMPKNSSNDMHDIFDSVGLLPFKSRTTPIRRSLRYCYKKISKII